MLVMQGSSHISWDSGKAATYSKAMLCIAVPDYVASVNFLHLGSLVSSAFRFLKWGQVIIISQALVVVINAEAELDHAVNAASKLRGLVQVEAGRKERGVKE